MTISSATSKNQYTANGSNTIFAYTFKIFDDSDIKVFVGNAVKVLTTDYSVSGVGNSTGGNITFVTAPANLAIVTIKRNEPLTQEIDYVDGDDFPAAAHEEGLDRSVIRDQFLQEQLDRALLLPESAVAGVTFPAPEANKLIAWNGDATNLINVALEDSVTGNQSIVGTLNVTGATTLNSTLGVTGILTASVGIITPTILDTNGNELVKFTTTASAVNEITITNAATGNPPSSSATGGDTNIYYDINSKGNLGVRVNTCLMSIHGQCRLVKSGSNLVLQPFDGDNLLIGTRFYKIPTAGVSLSPSGLTSSTVYYIYAYMSGATMTLEASTTGYATDTSSGIKIKSTDSTRTLVGMAWATGVTTWGAGNADVASWFNRRPIVVSANFTATRTTTSTSLVEINSEVRTNFLTWGDYYAAFNGAFFGSVVPQTLSSTLNLDGSTNLVGTAYAVTTGSGNIPLTFAATETTTEGRHYTTIFGAASTGTGSWASVASVTSGGILKTMVII